MPGGMPRARFDDRNVGAGMAPELAAVEAGGAAVVASHLGPTIRLTVRDLDGGMPVVGDAQVPVNRARTSGARR